MVWQASSPRWARASLWALAASTLALGLAHALYYFPRTVDDLYIFLRYAENLAGGHGLVYNLGERVEGYSSPLWLALLSIGPALGFNTLSWSKVLSTLSMLALGIGYLRLAKREAGLSSHAAWLSLALLAANSYLVAWVFWGLETPAYLALLVYNALALRWLAEQPGRRQAWTAATLGAALLLCRPEAPLLYGCIVAAVVTRERSRAALLGRVRTLLPALFGASAAWLAHALFRRVYFGLWLPHTYYAKQGSHFDPALWKALFSEGAPLPEAIYTGGGLLLAVWMALRLRASLALFLSLGTLFFVASVERDWMPSQRHFLPMHLLLPLPWLAFLQHCLRSFRSASGVASRSALALASTLVLVVVLSSAFAIGNIDGRHAGLVDGTWTIPKTRQKWEDSIACLSHRVPLHVSRMDPARLGMISQLFRLLESDAQPLERSWYVGRDIGRVGWLAPVKVFDTDGLFTPAVVAHDSWRETGHPEPALIELAFDRHVVMTELFDGWAWHAWQLPEIRERYRRVSPPAERHLQPRDAVPPSNEQLRARYLAALEKLPRSFYVATLWGEAVGAVLELKAVSVAIRTASSSPSK